MSVETIIVETKRFCLRCKSDKTYQQPHRLKNGEIKEFSVWHRIDKNKYLCRRCYQWYLNKTKRIKYKGQHCYLDVETELRIGICNLCRAVVGEINAQTNKLCRFTQRHHDGEYIDSNKTANTIEVCVSCHNKLR